MSNATLYTLIDIVFIDADTKQHYIATPGQCYLHTDNKTGVRGSVAGVWLYTGMQDAQGNPVLDNYNGACTEYELELLKLQNHPLSYPGGLRMCYSSTATEAARQLLIGEYKHPVFEHTLGVSDFSIMMQGALTRDYIHTLPHLYVKYSSSLAKELKVKDSDIVQLWDGSQNKKDKLDTFIRTSIPVLLEPLSVVAKRNKLSYRQCISMWNLAQHNACCTMGRQQLYIGWDPMDAYPTKTHRVSRNEYEDYSKDPLCGFLTPRVKVKSSAFFKDPYKHIDLYRASVDLALRNKNALHVLPTKLF